MAVGAGVTVYVLRRSRSGLGAFLPSRSDKHSEANLAEELATGAVDFVSDFRSAMRKREAELRAAALTDQGPQAGARSAQRAPGARPRDWGAYDPDDLNDTEADEPLYEF